MSDKKHCVEEVTSHSGWDRSRCPNKAKYGDYCGTHSPERRAERAKKRGPTLYERESAMRKEYRAALDEVLREARDIVMEGNCQACELEDALSKFDAVTQRVPGRLR